MKGSIRKASVLAAVAAVALAGCTGAPGTSGDPNTIRVTMDVPTSFDPIQSLGLPDQQLARLSFDTLVRLDDSGIVPGIASSWTAEPTKVTFNIRDDSTCADGTAVTPTVVAASLTYFAENGQPARTAEVFGGSVPTIVADDTASTVTITVEQPWSEMVAALTAADLGIICPSGLADPASLGTGEIKDAASGPYVLDSFEAGVRYTYKLRDDYDAWPEWTTEIEGDAPTTVEYIVAPDASATANLTLSGDLDASRIFPDSRSRFDGVSDVTLTSFPFGTFYIVFNEREGSPFVDKDARVAVAQVLDRNAFNDTATDGQGEVATTLASSATACATGEDSPAIIPNDPTAAAQVLTGLDIRLVGAQVVGANGAGNTYVEEVLRAAGANVTLDNTDIGSWAAKVFGEPGSWDLTVYPDLNFLGSLASPIQKFVGPAILEGGPNVGGADDPVASDLFDQARSVVDEASRCVIYNDALDSLIAEAHTVPLTIEPYIYATRTGYSVHMLGGSLDDHIFRIVS